MSKAYKQAGVDVEAGYESVNRMKQHIQQTMRPELMGAIGGFGGAFDLSALNYREPVLVSGTDGVGTKLRLAIQLERHDTIGIDAVAMCVNDIVTQGADPLFFLDYLACGHLIPEKAEAIVKGVTDGCIEAGCTLVGGETAEMPGMYSGEDYDIAGFAVGGVEKSNMITGADIGSGDVLIGLPSSGLHSNGFSLVRKIIADGDLDLQQPLASGSTLGEHLLTPTRIYVQPVKKVMNHFNIKGMAHITGGGFEENIPRMLPDGLTATINRDAWPVLDIFSFIGEQGCLSDEDLFATFNMGIGMVLAVAETDADAIIQLLAEQGEDAYVIGKVQPGEALEWLGRDHA
ncbi:phosphoribosylformylglycinamidine cyclo-ligase [Tuberibacillus sp. Marseille-P3662]|uniref:phosphoribosylformylglycinamidine cyclo-ligase n=1 Tax=Tuberibacillus sp. Marseille-P3662 TaxID=1965358 RepID=UPI000A1C8F8F|nr:phosphoribosylformylglycinamidine cyclo-ligase [Tuberibacillus sp. Marseille-P3662]